MTQAQPLPPSEGQGLKDSASGDTAKAQNGNPVWEGVGGKECSSEEVPPELA